MGMSTYNHNNSGDKNCQNRDALYHALMAVLLLIESKQALEKPRW